MRGALLLALVLAACGGGAVSEPAPSVPRRLPDHDTVEVPGPAAAPTEIQTRAPAAEGPAAEPPPVEPPTEEAE